MNLLVTGAWADAEKHIAELEEAGHEVKFLQYEKDPLPCSAEWIEGVICNGLFQWHPIERFFSLRYIQLTSAGYDRISIDYAEAHGIRVFNARGVYSIPMAEFAVCGILQLYKQTPFFLENQKRHCWEKHRKLRELYGQTVCLIGCGSVGTECAKRLAGFGCRIFGVDLIPRSDDAYETMVGITQLDGMLGKADIVILTVPLTEATRGMMSRERLNRMKDGSILVNISRGAVLDETALYEELPRLGGAVMDVFEKEPPEYDSPLWDLENVLITPHNSFVGDGNGERLWRVIRSNLGKFAEMS